MAPLWVQMLNLLVHCLSKDVGKKIGKTVSRGVNEAIIPQTGGKEGRHLKVHVVADISRPLPRGSTVKMNGAMKWIKFRYERCLDFCYACGIIGNNEKGCTSSAPVGKGQQEI